MPDRENLLYELALFDAVTGEAVQSEVLTPFLPATGLLLALAGQAWEVVGVQVDLSRAGEGVERPCAFPVSVAVVPAPRLRPLRRFDDDQPVEQLRQTAMLAQKTPDGLAEWLEDLAAELDVVTQLRLSAPIALAYLHRVAVATEYVDSLLAEILGAEWRGEQYGKVHGIWWGVLDSLAVIAGRELVRRCRFEVTPQQTERDRREVAEAREEGDPPVGVYAIHQRVVLVANTMQRLLDAAAGVPSYSSHLRATLSQASSAAAELKSAYAGPGQAN